MPCDACGGDGCRECLGRGDAVVRGCPQRLVTPDVWEALDAADCARHGAWEMPGGLASQTAIGVAAIRLAWAEEDLMRAELGVGEHGR